MFKRIDLEAIKNTTKVHPIEYHDQSVDMVTISRNKRIRMKNAMLPPGISMLHFRSKKTVELYTKIIHEMYESLGLPYTTGVTYYTPATPDRPNMEFYIPGTDLRKYLRDNDLLRKQARQSLHLFVKMPCAGWNIADSIESLDMSDQNKGHLTQLCVNLLKIFLAERDQTKIKELLDKSRLFFIRYIGYHKGHRLHLDSHFLQDGPVIICNFGVSTIDYVPYEEITAADPRYVSYRFRMDPGDVFVMDGDARRVYRHGVPPNESMPDYLRYVFCIRLPAVYPEKKKYCPFSTSLFGAPTTSADARYKLLKPINCSSISESMTF